MFRARYRVISTSLPSEGASRRPTVRFPRVRGYVAACGARRGSARAAAQEGMRSRPPPVAPARSPAAGTCSKPTPSPRSEPESKRVCDNRAHGRAGRAGRRRAAAELALELVRAHADRHHDASRRARSGHDLTRERDHAARDAGGKFGQLPRAILRADASCASAATPLPPGDSTRSTPPASSRPARRRWAPPGRRDSPRSPPGDRCRAARRGRARARARPARQRPPKPRVLGVARPRGLIVGLARHRARRASARRIAISSW